MKVFLTVDMEQDCPPYFETFRGVEEGTPRLLELFSAERISATFFSTGEVARRYPQTIQNILSRDHELGCHGNTHRRFDAMDTAEAEDEIRKSSEILRKFGEVHSFRAPNLSFPDLYLPLLEKYGYRIDSSQAKYKAAYRRSRAVSSSLLRIPASVTSSVLRLPRMIRFRWFDKLETPIVLFVHPWEFVDFRKTKLRLDCRFKTGQPALDCLRENIVYFKKRGAEFFRMGDLLKEAQASA